MSGTKAGGKLASETNRKNHGEDFYSKIGKMGGSVSGIKKGFALMPKERVSEIGKKGGTISRRNRPELEKIFDVEAPKKKRWFR